MITGDAISISAETATELVQSLGSVGKWLQAIGLIAVIWLIAQIINLTINKSRLKALRIIKKDIKRLEEKIDKLARKKR